jgi:D-glycero-D-manno-heptose 1,7-bisphosphate phosphatase
MKRRAIFLDRDGIINVDSPAYIKSWEEFRFAPGSLEFLRYLAETDCLIVVVSNQSAIGRGLTTEEKLKEIHERMAAEVTESGGRIDAIYYCPHSPDEGCACRKPMPGLLQRAANELNIDLANSFMLGDKASDVEAGRAAGCRTILLTEAASSATGMTGTRPDKAAQNLSEALSYIRNHSEVKA